MPEPQGYTKEQLKTLMGEIVSPLLDAKFGELEKTVSLHTRLLTDSEKRDQDEQVEKGLRFSRWVKSMYAGKYGGVSQLEAAKRMYPKDKTLEVSITKALGESTGAAGGFLVPVEFASEIIELLYNKTVVRRAGARVVPMATNTLNVPRLQGGATAGYIGENVNVSSSQQSFNQIQLSAKKLAVVVPVSNDLIRDSSPAADRIVRDDIVAQMAVTEDLNFIRGTGSSFAPKGISGWIPSSQVFQAGATGTSPSLAAVVTDLKQAVVNVKRGRKDQLVNPGWIFSVRTEQYLRNLLNANGFWVFRDEMDKGRLQGYPYYTTTQIPENLTIAGTDSSEIYFVDFSDAVIGENLNMEIAVSQEAAYFDGTNVQPAFAQDQTVIRALARHDFAMRHDFSATLVTGVEWT